MIGRGRIAERSAEEDDVEGGARRIMAGEGGDEASDDADEPGDEGV